MGNSLTMEQIKDKVTRSDRNKQIIDVIHAGLGPSGKTYKVNPVLDYIANLVEQAYIAGANSYNSSDQNRKELIDTGTILVLAKNFVKDKGLRI